MHSYSTTAKEYETLSKTYDSRFQSYIRAVADKILATAKLEPGSRIVDLGCGTGEVLLKLAKLSER